MSRTFNFGFSFVIITIAITFCWNGKNVHVIISDGALKGTIVLNYDGESIYAFTGIPYAKPPVGELRFKVSEKNEPWTGILDATTKPPMCRQPNDIETEEIGLEDCLYLNVFTKSVDVNSLKPVMVFIHGGQFLRGESSEHKPTFVLTKDIVYVTINYRLGVYGFINTVNFEGAADSEMIGNNGFKDQVLALKWIQSNIKQFGGDPDQVTITGESAGAVAVHGHMLSPLSAGLFIRGIAMTGTVNMVEAIAKHNTATPIADYLGLNTSNISSMMSQLRQASNYDLFTATKHLKWFQLQLNSPCSTCMVIEKPGPNSFLSDFPLNIIKNKSYSKVPIIFGTTNREGLLVYGLQKSQENLKDFKTHIPYFFTDVERAVKKIKQFYELTNDTAPDDNVINFYTDIWFKYNTHRAAVAHAAVQDNVFYYEFSVDAGLNCVKPKLPVASLWGACHADDLGYLTECAGIPAKNSIEEKIMRKMVKMWTNFVINGVPHNCWKKITIQKNNYVNITNSGLSFGKINEKSFKFWDKLYKVHGDSLN